MENGNGNNRDKVDQLRPHSFDGIQEYDNALPRWWLWLFYATILFTPIYLVYYHFGGGTSVQQELKGELAQLEQTLKQPTQAAAPIDYVALSKDTAIVAAGQRDYQVNCMPCHGARGEGGIGANLTDKFWLHGSSGEAVHKTIAQGVLDKGMPSWLPVLGVEKVNAITAYVLTLRNTEVPGGKAPQGNEEP